MDEPDHAPGRRRAKHFCQHGPRGPENQLPGRVQPPDEALPGAERGPGGRPQDVEGEGDGDGRAAAGRSPAREARGPPEDQEQLETSHDR